MKLPSASTMQRAFACPASFALPQVAEESSREARRGTTVHAFLRMVLTGEASREEALALVPMGDPGREACEAADLEVLPRGGLHEVAMAWDLEADVVRVLGYNIGRDYEAHGADRARELVGSFDLVGDLRDARVFVFDFKTGRPAVSARDSWQLRLGAVMWAKHRGADEALTGHLIVNDDVRWDLWEIDGLALKGYEAQARQQAWRLLKQRRAASLNAADVAEGDHCKYCPAWARCPAKTGLISNMATIVRTGGTTAYLEPATAAVAWRMLDKYDEIAKRMRAEIEKHAARAPIDLGDGYELREEAGEERDTVTDPVLALAILRDEFGSEAAMMMAAGTSKKALTAAAKKHGGEAGAARFLGRLRDRGVLAKRPGEVKVREVKKERI